MRTRRIAAALSSRISLSNGPLQTVAAMLFACLVFATQPSLAQDDAAVNDAYELAAQGLAAFNSGHFGEALDKYTRAYSIVKLPALAVHMARADVKLGRFVAAADLYQEATQLSDGVGEPTVQARNRGEAQVERSALLLRIPKLLIRVVGVESKAVSVQVDGATLPSESYESGWLVDPGTHKVTARFGNQQQEQIAAMLEGEARELRFTFEASPNKVVGQPAQSGNTANAGTSTMRTAAWAGFGVGGAGLLVSGITGLLALSSRHRADSTQCNLQPRGSNCDQSAADRYGTYRTIAGVSFYTGLAGVITGTALYFGEPAQKKTRDAGVHVLPWLGLESAGVEGRF